MGAAAEIAGLGGVCALGRNFAEISLNMFKAPPEPGLVQGALPFPFFSAALEKRRHSARDSFSLALAAAGEALAMAGWRDLDKCALIAGTTSGTALHFLQSYKDGAPGEDLSDYLDFNTGMALAASLGAKGLALTISNACASGADAIGLGLDLIRSGMAERVICGGADAFSLIAHTGFARLKLLDKSRCRPFSKDRRGLNLGEGAAFFCLEKKAKNPMGRVLGWGAASDAWHLTAPHPEGRGLMKALARAACEAGSGRPAFVNAHATGTRENDKVEGAVLKKAMPDAPVWASKPLTGHTLGAAGAIEALLTLAALMAGRLPAHHAAFEPDPEIGVNPAREESPVSGKSAVSLSLGFGGGNSVLFLEAE